MLLRKTTCLCSLILFTLSLHAQWTREDSVWIEGVKSGKIKLELNPETKKAIDEGRLIKIAPPQNAMRGSAAQLPITKEFTDIKPEEEEYGHSINPASLPPAILLRLDVPDSARIKSFVYVAPPTDYISMKLIPIGTSGLYVTAHTGDLNPIVKDGQSRGGAMGGVGFAFSMEDILRQIFMPSERAKKRNRKHATAWKYY